MRKITLILGFLLLIPLSFGASETLYSISGGSGNYQKGASSWNAVHDANASDSNSAFMLVVSQVNTLANPPLYIIERAPISFDLTDLSDKWVLDSAKVNVYVLGKSDSDNDAQAYISVVESRQESPSSRTNADYDDIGDSVNNPTKLSNDFDISSLTVSQYNTWTINDNGIDVIQSQIGNYSTLGMREGHDIQDIPIFGLGFIQNSLFSNLASTPAELEIEYHIPQVVFMRYE